MTLQDFIGKWQGKPVDFDGVYGAQCVDLVRQFFKDVWQLPNQPESVDGAVDFYFKHYNRPIQKQFCECVFFDGAVRPPVGSVVIFKATDKNKHGHIGICVSTDKYGMNIFEQDGVANEKALAEGRTQKGAYISYWTYERLLGWLIKR